VDGPEGWSGSCLASSTRVGFVSRDGITGGFDEAGSEGRVPEEGLEVEDAGKAQCSGCSQVQLLSPAGHCGRTVEPHLGVQLGKAPIRGSSVSKGGRPSLRGQVGLAAITIDKKKRHTSSHPRRPTQGSKTLDLAAATNM
jgi:hypothetical protein